MKKPLLYTLVLTIFTITACHRSAEKKATSINEQAVSAYEPAKTEQSITGDYNKILTSGEIRFNISAKKENGQSEITVTPSNLEIDNSPITQTVDGGVVDAVVSDLNADGSPELLIFTRSDGSGSYGNVVAFSVNNKKSMSMVYFPPITDNAVLGKGYMGHDEFRVVDKLLIQRFPIYNEGDSNADPTGGIRQISYEMIDGEAMRKFEVKNITTIKR